MEKVCSQRQQREGAACKNITTTADRAINCCNEVTKGAIGDRHTGDWESFLEAAGEPPFVEDCPAVAARRKKLAKICDKRAGQYKHVMASTLKAEQKYNPEESKLRVPN